MAKYIKEDVLLNELKQFGYRKKGDSYRKEINKIGKADCVEIIINIETRLIEKVCEMYSQFDEDFEREFIKDLITANLVIDI